LIKPSYNKQSNISFIPVIKNDEDIDESTLSAKELQNLEEKRILEYDIDFQFLKTQIFLCFKNFIYCILN